MANSEIQTIDIIDENNDKIISSDELKKILAIIESDKIDDSEQLDALALHLSENKNKYSFPVFDNILKKDISNLTKPEKQIRYLYSQFENINELNQEILAMGGKLDYIKNLEYFGIGEKAKPNRGKISKNVKTNEDINKITNDNIADFIDLPDNTKQSDIPFITMNFKVLLKDYVTYYPNYKSPFVKNGLVTGVDMKNIKFNINKFKVILGKIKKMEEGKINIKNGELDLSNEYLRDAFKLHIQGKCKDKTDKQQGEILGKTFKGREAGSPSESGLLNTGIAKRDPIMKGLIDSYIISKVQVYKKTGKTKFGQEYFMLDINKEEEYSNLLGKGSEAFDDLYKQTSEFYKGLSDLGIQDKNISIDKVLDFYTFFGIKNKEIANEEENKTNYRKKATREMATGHIAGMEARKAIINSYDTKINNKYIELEKAYAMLLLQQTPKPTGKQAGITGKISLDFSKGTSPDKIVRDSFGEMTADQRDIFVDDLKNNRQRAFGSFTGMVGGIVGAGAMGLLTKNIRATSAGFTAGLRLGNGIGQETRNAGEYIYESAGGELGGTNNKVDTFGTSFLRGVGAYNENDERVGTWRFLGDLTTDYFTTLATFGIGNKIAPFLGKIKGLGGIKGIGGKAFVFGAEELFIESFLVDIPMNILQTGVYTYTGIGDGVITGQTALGSKTDSGGGGKYKSGSFLDAVVSMKDAVDQNFSFANLSQVFLNTVMYGGLLEGGQGGISRIKQHLPTTEVNNFESVTKNYQQISNNLSQVMLANNITLDKKTNKLINKNTNQALQETDAGATEVFDLLKTLTNLENQSIATIEELKTKQEEIVKDPNNKKGLFLRLGLVSALQTPQQIINTRLENIDKKIEKENKKENPNQKTIQRLLYLKSEYERAKIMTNIETYTKTQLKSIQEYKYKTISGQSIQENFKTKLNDQNAEIPMKDGKPEYLYNNAEVNIENTRKGFKGTLSFLGQALINKNWILKTPFSFSTDSKIPGDCDVCIDPQGFKNMLPSLIEQATMNKGKELENIQNGIGALELIDTSGSSWIKIENTTENQSKINQLIQNGTIKVGFHYFVDGVGVDVEIFSETGNTAFDIMGKNKTNTMVPLAMDGIQINTMTPESYQSYVENLLADDFTKELSDTKVAKLKVAKRINDYMETLEIIASSDSQKGRPWIKQTVTNFISKIFGLGTTKKVFLINSIKDSSVIKNKNKEEIKWIDVLSESREAHKTNPGQGTTPLPSLNFFMNLSEGIKIGIKNEINRGDGMNPDTLLWIKEQIELQLGRYDYRGEKNFHMYNEYYLLKVEYGKKIDKAIAEFYSSEESVDKNEGGVKTVELKKKFPELFLKINKLNPNFEFINNFDATKETLGLLVSILEIDPNFSLKKFSEYADVTHIALAEMAMLYETGVFSINDLGKLYSGKKINLERFHDQFVHKTGDLFEIYKIQKEHGITIPQKIINNQKSSNEYYKDKLKDNTRDETYMEELELNSSLLGKVSEYLDTKKTENLNKQEVINYFKNDILGLPPKIQLKYIEGICKYIDACVKSDALVKELNSKSDKEKIEYFMNKFYPDSPHNPSRLASAITGFSLKSVGPSIIIEPSKGDLNPYIVFTHLFLHYKLGKSGGAAFLYQKDDINFVVLKKFGDKGNREHETRHIKNSHIFSEFIFNSEGAKETPKNRAKDEVIAYTTQLDYAEGMDYSNIQIDLLEKKGLYDYYWDIHKGTITYIQNKIEKLKLSKNTQDKESLREMEIDLEKNIAKYEASRGKHKQEVLIMINIAEKFENLGKDYPNSGLTKDKVLTILSLTPSNKWGYVLGLYETKYKNSTINTETMNNRSAMMDKITTLELNNIKEGEAIPENIQTAISEISTALGRDISIEEFKVIRVVHNMSGTLHNLSETERKAKMFALTQKPGANSKLLAKANELGVKIDADIIFTVDDVRVLMEGFCGRMEGHTENHIQIKGDIIIDLGKKLENGTITESQFNEISIKLNKVNDKLSFEQYLGTLFQSKLLTEDKYTSMLGAINKHGENAIDYITSKFGCKKIYNEIIKDNARNNSMDVKLINESRTENIEGPNFRLKNNTLEIGDVDGSFTSYISILIEAGLVVEKKSGWKNSMGKNRTESEINEYFTIKDGNGLRIDQLGDFSADRASTSGLGTLENILITKGYNIKKVTGNHDMQLLRVLGGMSDQIKGQSTSMNELFRYLPEHSQFKKGGNLEQIFSNNQTRVEFIKDLTSTKEGFHYINFLKNQEVFRIIEDSNGYLTIKMHTPMTQGIVNLLGDGGVNTMNKINKVQKNYLNDLFDPNISIVEIKQKYDEYFEAMDIVVYTNNRSTSTDVMSRQLSEQVWIDFCKQNNIKSFVYGHEGGDGVTRYNSNPTPSNPEILCLDMNRGMKKDLLRTQR